MIVIVDERVIRFALSIIIFGSEIVPVHIDYGKVGNNVVEDELQRQPYRI